MPISKSDSRILGITLGDPGGIGPEVVAKALMLPSTRSLARYKIIGDISTFSRYLKRLPRNCDFIDLNLLNGKKIVSGEVNRINGAASLQYLQKAVELIKNNHIQGLVTAPVCKEAVALVQPSFKGHTEFLAENFKIKNVGMMFVCGKQRTVIATRHMALNKVSRALNAENIFETIFLTHGALKRLFRIRHPKIAVCGLNPHAGEGGNLGKEERTEIIPAIAKAKKNKINVVGPLPADTLFYPPHCRDYDGLIAMYHDQGLAPVKALYFRQLVNLTIGLPFIRTSPAHGTAFDIAGKNKADPSSMAAAIELAAQLIS